MNHSTYTTEHNRLFGDLQTALRADMAKISVQANGGRSILFVYPPIDEALYIDEAKSLLADECSFIDLRKLYVQFIDEYGVNNFKETFEEFGTELFASNNFDNTFLSLILDRIQSSYDVNKIPVLIHTGVIYGMGFRNTDIMEKPFIMTSKIPLVVFYPATIDNDKIMFLGKEVASKYRCIVIK